jgi:hypothetical protein
MPDRVNIFSRLTIPLEGPFTGTMMLRWCYAARHHHNPGELTMTEIDDVSARLIVLETVVKQLITHMAIRDDNPERWVQTRKTLAMSVIDAEGPVPAALLHDAMAEFFDQAESVAGDYSTGTPGPLER